MDLMINRFIYTSIYCRIGIKDGSIWLSMTQIEVNMRIVTIFLMGLFTIGSTYLDTSSLQQSNKLSSLDQVIYDEENPSEEEPDCE